MAKSGKRAKALSEKRARKANILAAKGKSKYAIKRSEQARGRYRKTSPFFLSPEEIRMIEMGFSQ